MAKSKYSNCESCTLYTQTMVVGETNSKNNISNIDLLILAEAPSHEEIKQNKPLVGPSGKVFREVFKQSKLIDVPHMISNVVMCTNIQDGKTKTPPDSAIESCKPNWKKLIDVTKPKLIIVLGTTPMKALGIADSGITSKRGNFFKYENYPVLVTFHPSYLMRKGGLDSEEGQQFTSDLMKAYNRLSGGEGEETRKNKTVSKFEEADAKYKFQLPKWCYSSEVCLFDIQRIRSTNELLFIFHDKNGKRIFHKEDANNKYFYSILDKRIENAPMLASLDEVELHTFEDPREFEGKALYESDLKTEIRHAIDYRSTRKADECKINLKIMMFDIEVYSRGRHAFPDPKEAKSPINAISFKIDDGPVNVFLTKFDDSKIKPISGFKIKTFSSEKDLLEAWFEVCCESNIDIICGWNCNGFDLPTIYGRARKIGADINKMSPIGKVSINPNKYGDINIFGIANVDLYELYKKFTYSVEESYKLDYIATKQLGTGKVEYTGSLDTLWTTDINKFIQYSGIDTDLLYQINQKMGHIDLLFELIRICNTTWKSAETTTGQVDPLCVSYANNKGLLCRNSLQERTEETIPGAYVRTPSSGLHANLIDLDFTSLYPSIIRTCNIGPNTYVARLKTTDKNKIWLNQEEKSAAYFNREAYQWIYDRENMPDTIELELEPLNKNHRTMKISRDQFAQFLEKIDGIVTISGCIFKGHNKEISFFTEILTYLMDSRKDYKNKMKDAIKSNDSDLRSKYNNIQMAYKILANSLYGVLANWSFRFFNLDMAKTITITGQELVKFSGFHLGQYMATEQLDIVKDFHDGYDKADVPYVIYQDTDSIFVQMGDWLEDKGKL